MSTDEPSNTKPKKLQGRRAERRQRARDRKRRRRKPFSLGARLRNYFLTGLVVVGPITITIYIVWWFIQIIDAWVKPFVPEAYDPDTYLPFHVPGIGLIFGVIALIAIGALAANLFGKTIISFGELFLGRMPIVRNVHRALKQIFESVITASESGFMDGNNKGPHRVGLVEFPSKGIWSIVYVTGEASGAIMEAQPGGETDLIAAFMPTGMVPPTGFVCFIPRRNVIFLPISMEDAAKTVVSAGMFMPEQQEQIKAMLRQANASLDDVTR
ncbi:MAG: DUF502 domain-containing protein [Pseudomonadota bacterium]